MTIADSARRVARLLKASGQRVVFAESCTGGLVSGSLTRIPGISEHHCGGMVVYRNATKTRYLGIPERLLDDPGPVSREVAELLAERVLDRTPEATIALSVTGHLGPQRAAQTRRTGLRRHCRPQCRGARHSLALPRRWARRPSAVGDRAGAQPSGPRAGGAQNLTDSRR